MPQNYNENVKNTLETLKTADLKTPQDLFNFAAHSLGAGANPDHPNVMLYTGSMAPGNWPNFPEVGGIKEAMDLAREFAKFDTQGEGQGPGGTSIIDNTDRARFMNSKEFGDNCLELTEKNIGNRDFAEHCAKLMTPAIANDPAKLGAATDALQRDAVRDPAVMGKASAALQFNGESSPWAVASAEFAQSATGKNIIVVLPQGDIGRVFGKTELPGLVKNENAALEAGQDTHTKLAGKEMAEYAKAYGAPDGAKKVFEALKEISKESNGYLFTRLEVNDKGEIKARPMISEEFQKKMGMAENPGLSKGIDLAMDGMFQGLRPSKELGVNVLNGLTDRLQEAGPIHTEQPITMMPGDLPKERQAQLAAIGGKDRPNHTLTPESFTAHPKYVAPEAGPLTKEATVQAAAKQAALKENNHLGSMQTERGYELPKEAIQTVTGNVQPLKPFNGKVKQEENAGVVTVTVDAAQSRLKQVDFKVADHPELAKAEKGDWVRCDVKNGKIEPQLIKAVGAAGQTLDAAQHLKGLVGPGAAGAAVDAAAHAAVSLGQHRAAPTAPTGRGGR